MIPVKPVYKTIEVPAVVEKPVIIKQRHHCIMPELYFETWGDLLIAYRRLEGAFSICVYSLE
jgi:hypothetical protein